MTLNNNKGYSLIEVGVGIIILTIFLLTSIALFNGCYNTYRRINQRNIAMEYAVKSIESMLQTDSAELTGFYEVDEVTGYAVPNSAFKSFVSSNFNKYKKRYVDIFGGDESLISTSNITDEQLLNYIEKDKHYLIDRYIEADTYTQEELENGTYGFLINNITELRNPALIHPEWIGTSQVTDDDIEPTNSNSIGIRRTVTRIPSDGTYGYGNNILKLKVEVFYTRKLNYKNLSNDDIESITLETLKLEN